MIVVNVEDVAILCDGDCGRYCSIVILYCGIVLYCVIVVLCDGNCGDYCDCGECGDCGDCGEGGECGR